MLTYRIADCNSESILSKKMLMPTERERGWHAVLSLFQGARRQGRWDGKTQQQGTGKHILHSLQLKTGARPCLHGPCDGKLPDEDVRGLCIATGQYSSFRGCAVDLVLGGFDHMEDDDQDRGDEENEQEVETLEREEEVNGWRDNAQSDTW